MRLFVPSAVVSALLEPGLELTAGAVSLGLERLLAGAAPHGEVGVFAGPRSRRRRLLAHRIEEGLSRRSCAACGWTGLAART